MMTATTTNTIATFIFSARNFIFEPNIDFCSSLSHSLSLALLLILGWQAGSLRWCKEGLSTVGGLNTHNTNKKKLEL